MITLLVFGITLLVAILLSELSGRSVLSTAVLFLVAGFVAGPAAFNLIAGDPHRDYVRLIANAALCSVLFTDGMRASIRDVAAALASAGPRFASRIAAHALDYGAAGARSHRFAVVGGIAHGRNSLPDRSGLCRRHRG